MSERASNSINSPQLLISVFHSYDFCDQPGEKFMKKNDESVFIRLCDEFYKRVFADEDKFFRDLFATANMEDASQNLCEYLVQRFGGSNEYSNRNGIVNLVSFHAKIGITEKAMRRWLQVLRAYICTIEYIKYAYL